MKTRQELIEQQERLLKLQAEVEEELLKIPGVISVGIGLKETAGVVTDEISFRVYVEEKKAVENIPSDQMIPAEIKGIKVDVIKIEEVEPLSSKDGKIRPLKGGIKILNSKGINSGTLGCLAKLNSDGTLVLLSNQHVLYGSGATKGDGVGQPTYKASSCHSCSTVVGEILKGKRENKGSVDCAIAKITGVNAVAEIDKIGDVAGSTAAIVGEIVRKVGKTTGLTTGKIIEIKATSSTRSANGTNINLIHQIEIGRVDESGNFINNKKFSDSGDSGSVIVNEHNEVVGLLWGNFGNGISQAYKSSANNIANVLEEMDISILTSTASMAEVLSASEPTALRAFSLDENFQKYEQEINTTANGRATLALIKPLIGQQRSKNNPVIQQRVEEVVNLVHHNRAVMVAWHRNEGPAFVESYQQFGDNPDAPLPKEINGVGLTHLLDNMATALDTHGSPELAEDIQTYKPQVMSFATNLTNFKSIIDAIKIGSFNCSSMRLLWQLIWQPSGAFYLPNVLENGVSLDSLTIPSLQSVNAGDVPQVTLFKEPVLGYIRFETTNSTITGLPTIHKGEFKCEDSAPSETKLTLGFSFDQITFSGSYTVSSGGITGCAIQSAAFLMGGGIPKSRQQTLNGTFKDVIKNASITGAIDLSVDNNSKFLVTVTNITANIPSLDIKLATTDTGWAPGLFDKVQNAIANTQSLKDELIRLAEQALAQPSVRDEIGRTLTAALNNI